MDNISEFIKNNPERAQAYAIESQEYAKKNRIPPLKTKVELAAWLSANKLSVDPGKLDRIWIGVQISQALSNAPPPEPEAPQETPQESGFSQLIGLALLPLSPFLKGKGELMEDDSKFKKIEENLKEEWLKNNPGKDFSSKEGLDYLHGNLDGPDAPTLQADAEKAFREKNPKKAAGYDRKARKAYKNPDEDPAISRAKRNIDEHIKARKAYFERNGLAGNWDEIQKKIKDQEWDRFAKRYSEKAKAYRGDLSEVDNAIDRHEIRQHLSEYAKSPTGKEVKLTQKIKREAPLSREEVSKRLEAIQPHVPTSQIYVPHEKPLTAAPVRSAPRDLGPRRRRGLMDGLNRLPSLFGNLQAAEQAVGQTATRALGFFARLTPIGWAGIGLLVLFIFAVIIIVFNPSNLPLGLGGGGGDGGQQTQDGQIPSFPPLPGLTLTLIGPDAINNGELLSYTVDVSYDASAATVPIDEITVFDNVPQNTDFFDARGVYQYDSSQRAVSWKLSEQVNQAGFSITLKPLIGDFFVSNKVYARASIPPTTGGFCSEGSGFCSAQYLTGFFPDATKARQASIICQRESGSNPGALNNGCLSGKSADYSVGLFQINLLAHCPGAFSSYTIIPPSCTVADQKILDACVNKFSDPVENIKKAAELSSGGTYWVPWAAAKACGIIN